MLLRYRRDKNVLYDMQFASAPVSSLHFTSVELMRSVFIHDVVAVDVHATGCLVLRRLFRNFVHGTLTPVCW